MAVEASSPKTTRPSAKKQRDVPAEKSTAKKINRKLDAFPDKIDVRDWFYQPSLNALPDQLINCDNVPAIMNQGAEGACTGFALAASIAACLNWSSCFAKSLSPLPIDRKSVV